MCQDASQECQQKKLNYGTELVPSTAVLFPAGKGVILPAPAGGGSDQITGSFDETRAWCRPGAGGGGGAI